MNDNFVLKIFARLEGIIRVSAKVRDICCFIDDSKTVRLLSSVLES